jgi:TonB-linked SusC/RagA family outer membrane protein
MKNARWLKNTPRFLLFLFLLAFSSQASLGQTNGHSTVLSYFKHQKDPKAYIKAQFALKEALAKVEKDYDVVFLYKSGLLDHQKVFEALPNEGLMALLHDLFQDRDLTYKKIGEREFGIVHKDNPAQSEKNIAAYKVIGTVTRADNGNTLPGVNVRVKGTSQGAITNKNGVYSINATSAQDTLVFSYIGFQTKIVPINDRSIVNVAMQTKIYSGKELIVIGYGKQQKQHINGAISTVSSKDIQDIPEVSVSQLLQGQAAGVTVTHNSGQPGAAASVHIRGITSPGGNNQPLYVIDGVPVPGDATNTATSGKSPFSASHGNSTVSPLSMLNPNDIESITILKDASAQAIYGSRGANGVVLITTKSGHKGQGKITYNGSVSTQGIVKRLDVMNLRQYAEFQNVLKSLFKGKKQSEIFSRPDILGKGTNWQKALYRHGMIENHNLSFSGGSENVNYYLSGGYLDRDGIQVGSNFNRYTLNTKIDADVTNWLKVGVNINASSSEINMPRNGSIKGMVHLALEESPANPVYNADGSFAGRIRTPIGTTEGTKNPVMESLRYMRKLMRRKLLGGLHAQINLTKGLSFKSSFSGSFELDKNNKFTPTYDYGIDKNTIATSYDSRQNYNSWDWKNYFTYKHIFPAENQITWLLGQEAQQSTWEGIKAGGQDYITNNVRTLNQAQPSSIGGFKGAYTMASYYTRLIYSFRNKYGFTATFRADGSSKFDKGHQWGYFPSIGAHWSIYKEPWMRGLRNVLSDLKLKAGYGVTGNQSIGNYLFTSTLTPIQTGFGMGFSVSNLSNPNLRWEDQTQLNLGLTIGFLEDRLKADVDVYNKLSDNFLFTLPLPSFLAGGVSGYMGGLHPPTVNSGKMRNRGIDVTLSYQMRQSHKFSWNSKLTFSHYKNKVVSMPKEIKESINNGFTDAVITNSKEGGSVGRFWGYKVKGLFRDAQTLKDQPKQFKQDFGEGDVWLGDVQYVNVNGDSLINSEDKTFIGDPNPLFTYGFINHFSYKNVSLSLFIQGVYGNDIFDFTNRIMTGLYHLSRNQLAEARDYYTPLNTDAKYPRPRLGQTNQNMKISDRWVEDGSYLRIKNVQLGYTIPEHLTHKLHINRVKVYGSVENLYTFTNYSGYSPEIGDLNQNALRAGIDNSRYPPSRVFTIGLNIDF